VVIASVRPETRAMCVVRLELSGTPLAGTYTRPGQYVKARFAGEEAKFAFASAPARAASADGVEILVKQGGRVGDALCAAAPGTRIELSKPTGRGFPVDDARGRSLLLCAAGSGIGPIRAVIQYVIERRAAYRDVTLIYGQRAEEDFAFSSEHAGWQKAGIDVVTVHSRPGASEFAGVRGYVQDALRSIKPEVADAWAFLCGMQGMVEGATSALVELGMPRAHIFLNY